MVDIDIMIGKIMASVEIEKEKYTNEALIFTDTEGLSYVFCHSQDCCEAVYIEDVAGDLNDLTNSPILVAEKSTKDGEKGYFEYYTWTFYKFSTIKGSVTIRWYGTSNGYYSQEVDFDGGKKLEDMLSWNFLNPIPKRSK